MSTPTNISQTVQRYRQFALQTAPHKRAIYLLHEKCVHQIALSRSYAEKRRELLNRAQNILSQLQTALHADDDVSCTLFLLYDYCYVQLNDPPVAQNITNALAIMNTLKNTFRQLVERP
jgi:flagellar biosynthetic protein FliS